MKQSHKIPVIEISPKSAKFCIGNYKHSIKTDHRTRRISKATGQNKKDIAERNPIQMPPTPQKKQQKTITNKQRATHTYTKQHDLHCQQKQNGARDNASKHSSI